MNSNITINVVEPGSPTPIDPVTPNTGLFTSGTSGPEATIITAVSAVLILTIVAIVITSLLYRKQKKSGKVTKLVHLVDSTKAVLKSNKRITTAIILLAILTSTGTFIALARNAVNASESDEQSQTEGTNDSNLTVDVSSEELTIEVGDAPVFAILPVEVTVEEATEAGYTLTASTDSTDLVSTTDSSKVIPMVAADEGELVALADNTYGLALEKPTTKDEAVYTALSADSSNPTILKAVDDYSSTPANDTTTIYYGFYITPDVPYGTYTGSTISYEAIPNLATISYNANGLYYNNDESFTTNTVGYKPSTPDSPIEELSGEYLAPAPLNPDSSSSPIHYTFLGWSKTEGATTPDYEDEEDIIANLTLSPNEDLTLYAVWHYDTVLSFNGTTSDGGTPMEDITIPAGTTITLPPNTYTRTGSVFTSWNTVAIPTEQDPGEDYEDEADFTAPDSSADITLYAQWAYYTTITFNGNGETSGYMSPQDIIAGTPENLVPNAYTKTNHTFIGWNTSPDGTGTSYADQAEFIASSTQHEDITLYAQWAATTISFSGNTSESGTMNPITIAGGEQVTLPQNAYTKSHCTFTSWNTNPDGTGTRYPGEASYTASMDGIYSFTLYAQWQCESMINFNGNGATSGYMPGIMATGGQQTTLPQNTFTKDGYAFNGWNTVAEPTEQDPGEAYADQGIYIAPVSESQNITLYAQWAATTITFSGNGATSGSMDQFNIPAGTTVNLPQNTFTRTGYVFNGWNTSSDGTGTSYSDQSSYYATAGVNTSVTLHAQWLPTTTITFDGNGADSGSMAPQTIVAGTPQNLTPNAYAKDGYTFNGWNTVQTPTTENPGTAYADKVQYTASTIAAENVTLYAQWKLPPVIGDLTYMQDFALLSAEDKVSVLNSMSQETSYTLKDKRDEQDYAVAKLKDNNIWMTKNLNLAGGTEITSELSNVPDGYTLPTANGFQSGNKLPTSYRYSFSDDTKAFVYNSTKTSGTDCTSSGCYSYYSWTAATAGSGLSITEDDTDAPYSICPKGWKLPSTRTTDVADWKTESDFYQLAVAYGMDPSSTSQFTENFYNQAGPGTTPNFLLTGYYDNGSFKNGGSSGHYWSSTSSSSTSARSLYFRSSSVSSADSGGRRRGHAVRCVAE